MARKKAYKKTSSYNRTSKGMQGNLARMEAKRRGIEDKGQVKQKRIKRGVIITAAVWLILTIVFTYMYGVSAFISMLMLGVIISASWLIYINRIEKKIIGSYKEAGITKEAFIEELIKRRVPAKRVNRLSKMWDKAKAEEVKLNRLERRQQKQ